MLKFMRGRGPHLSAERQKLQKELFAFNKTVSHGFPNRPTCLAYDKELGLLAVGTRTGQIRVYGKPGVELEGQFDAETEITQIAFIENKGRLVSLSDDSSIHLWEINEKLDKERSYDVIEKVKSCDYFSKEQREGSLKQVTTVVVDSSKSTLLVGTKGGNIYMVDIETFELTDQIIYQDVVLQNIPEEHKKISPGEVELIAEQPSAPGKFLIGFNKGLLVLWDNKNLLAEHFYVSNQQVEAIDWLNNGDQFITAHNDGSFIHWRVSDNLHPIESPKITYGPFPCKPITKITRKTVKGQEDYVIFAGGMPRASYGDKNTVSIIQGNPEKEKHHVLDFTSKIIDFVVLDKKDEDGADNPQALIVLAEEELVAIDLSHPDWLQFRLPYLSSVHSSAITHCQHYSNIPEELFDRLREAGAKQVEGKYTDNPWPIAGGNIVETNYAVTRNILITGHEDGTVRFWAAGGVSLQPLYILNTSKLFYSPDDDIAPIDGDDIPPDEAQQNGIEWPPFRKVGTYDPFSDDVRLAIRKIVLCPRRNILVIAGTAGQVVVFELVEESVEKPLTVVTSKITEDNDGFIWKGHGKLNPTNGNVKFESGFQPRSLLQITPPAAVTALTCNSDWSLISVGTSHGFTIYDYMQINVVLSKCTLTPTDAPAAASGDALVTRRKSFKKSLRESFRRLRRNRGPPRSKSVDQASSIASSPSPSPSKSEEVSKPKPAAEEAPASAPTSEATPAATETAAPPASPPPPAPAPAPAPVPTPTEKKITERHVEARAGSEDETKSMVRCVYFAKASIASGATPTPTFWVGTNAGLIYVYALTVPAEEKRETTPVSCQLAKEIQLKHGAPVIFIHIMNSGGHPLPEIETGPESEKSTTSSSGPSRVLICSEEQFKLFTLPSLKPFCKFKLTANEGSRARRIAFAQYVSKSDEKHVEDCLLCLTNQGDVTIHTGHDLKKQLQTQCTKKEDINGITSLVFTSQGEGFYLQAPSEFKRFSTSAARVLRALCHIELPEGCRPAKEAPQPPIAAASIEPIIEKVSAEEKKAADEAAAAAKNVATEDQEKKPEKEESKSEAVVANDVPAPQVNGVHLQNSNEEETVKEKPVNGTEPANSPSKISKTIVNGVSDKEEIIDGVHDLSIVSTESMDMTIDSIKDHITSMMTTEVISSEVVVKKTTKTVETTVETTPVINSQED